MNIMLSGKAPSMTIFLGEMFIVPLDFL